MKNHVNTQIARENIDMQAFCFFFVTDEKKEDAIMLLDYINRYFYWQERESRREAFDDDEVATYSRNGSFYLVEQTAEQCGTLAQLFLMKAVKKACFLNSYLSRDSFHRFINRWVRKTDEAGPNNYDPHDSCDLICEFAECFSDYFGQEITDVRWENQRDVERFLKDYDTLNETQRRSFLEDLAC